MSLSDSQLERDRIQKMMLDWAHNNFDLGRVNPLMSGRLCLGSSKQKHWSCWQNQMEMILESDIIMIRIMWIFSLQKVKLLTWYPRTLSEFDVADPDFFNKLKTAIDQRIDDYIQKFPPV